MSRDLKYIVSAEDRSDAGWASFRRKGGAAFDDMEQRVSAGAANMGGAIAAAIGGAFTAAGIATFVANVVASIDALNDASDATGITIQKMSALDDFARRTGTTLQEVTGVVLTLQKSLSKAGDDDTKGVGAALKAIGLDAEELRKIDPADAIKKVADALDGFDDGAGKTRVIQTLFKDAQTASPILKDLAEQQELVGKVSKQQADEVDKLIKSWSGFKADANGVAVSAANVIVPALNSMISYIRQASAEGGQLTRVMANLLGGPAIRSADYLSGVIGPLDSAERAAKKAREASKVVEEATKGIAEAQARLEKSESARKGADWFGARLVIDNNISRAKSDIAKFTSEINAAKADLAQLEKAANDAVNPPSSGKPVITFDGGKGGGSGGSASAAAKGIDEFRKALEKVQALEMKNTGLDADYWSNIETLFKGYQQGKISVEDYRGAVDTLTKSQKFHTDAVAEAAKAAKEAEKAQADYYEAWSKYLGGLDEEADKLEEQAKQFGMSKTAIAQLTLARTEERLEIAKANGVADEYLAKLEEEVEARRRIAEATSSVEVAEANKKAADDAAAEWKRISDDVGRGLTDAIFEGGKDGWEQLRKTIEATLIRAYIQPVIAQGMQLGTDALGWAANAGLSWITGSPTITGSSGGQGSAAAGYANTISTISTLYKASAALYAKITASGAAGGAAGGTGLTLGTGAPGMTAGAGGQTGLTLGTGATGQGAASTSGLSSATIGWVAAIAMGMYMSSQAWKSGVRPNGKWSDTSDAKSWPMRFWDNQYYLDKAMYGKEFAGSELNAILSGSSLSKVVHEALFGGSKRDTGEYALRATLAGGGTDTDIGAYWKKNGGLFGSDKRGIRWADASAELDAALETVIDSVKGGMLKLGDTLADTTLADKIARYTGSFDAKIGDNLEQTFGSIGQKFRDALAQSLLPSIESLRKTTTDSSGKSSTEAWDTTFTRVLDQANLVVGMLDTMGRSVSSTFGPDNAERVLGLSDALVSLFGSADALTQQFDAYYQSYYSDAEKIANTQRKVGEGFAEMGLAMPATRAEFRALVEGLDLTSSSGQATYAALIGISSAFGVVADATTSATASIQQQIMQERAALEQQLMQATGDITGLRALELAGIDESNRALRERIWAIEDEAAIQAAITQNRAAVETSVLNALGNTAALRERELSALDPVNRSLRGYLYAIDDQRTALQGATDDINQFYTSMSGSFDQLSDSWGGVAGQFAEMGLAVPQSIAAFKALVSSLDLTTDSGLKQAKALMSVSGAFAQAQGTLDNVLGGVQSSYQSSVRNIQMSVLDEQGKYSYLDNEASRYRAALSNADDPDAIASLAENLRSTIDQAYALLSDEQRKATSQEFIARYAEAQTLVQARLAESRAEMLQDQVSMADQIRKAVADGYAAAVQTLGAAAAAIPTSIAITVSGDAGLTTRTEVGY